MIFPKATPSQERLWKLTSTFLDSFTEELIINADKIFHSANSLKAFQIPNNSRIEKTGIPPRRKPEVKNLDLGKISSLVQDSRISLIDCSGAGGYTAVVKDNIRSVTPIVLNEDEIRGIISKFARAVNKYPEKGIFHAAYGTLLITAVISDLAGSRFIITKR